MRVVFRVEGEPSIGLGHMMRCLALAQSLTSNGHEVIFIMSPESQEFCQKRTDWVGRILPLPSNPSKNEANWLNTQCEELLADWLVLDGYQFDQAYRQLLCPQEQSCNVYKFAVFDDINDSGLLHANLVINGASNALQLNYAETAPHATLAIGQKYQVLRQEFLQLEDRNWSDRKNLTLMFGGSDPNNMTLLVLKKLSQLEITLPIVVVTGAAYVWLNELNDFICNSALDITHHHDCQNMAAVLVSTRLALSAAGGSQFELAACATPAILVVVAENQTLASQHAATQGWCQVVNRKQTGLEELVSQCLSLWQQSGLLQSMHQQALKLPVVNGAEGIVDIMLKAHLGGNGL